MTKFLKLFLVTLSLLGILQGNVSAGEIEQRAFVERFYLNILDRSSDTGGMATWLDVIQNQSATKVALGFFKSQEFINKNLSNEEFVDILYTTLFDRQADSDGRTYWIDKLNSNTSKNEVMYGFFNGTEFKNLSDSYGVIAIRDEDQLDYNPYGNTGVDGYVNRFYTLVLNRTPDDGGFTDWTTQLNNQTKAGGDIAKGFFNSTEYTNRNLDNSTFLDICYKAFFDRDADEGGKTNWLGVLQKGGNITDVLDGFIASIEFSSLANSFGIEPGTVDEVYDNSINLTLKNTFELPYEYSSTRENILMDNDNIILFGGAENYFQFSNKILKINLITGEKKELEMNPTSGSYGNSISINARDNTAIVYRIGKNKYFIAGGGEYINNIEIADFNTMSIKSIPLNFEINDSLGLRTNTYFVDKQASSMADDGNIYFFGSNNSFNDIPHILKFNISTEEISLLPKQFGIAGYDAFSIKLSDGRILIIEHNGHFDLSEEKRVDIFNPVDNSVIQVANVTDLELNTHFSNSFPLVTVNSDFVCIRNKKYNISEDIWNDCEIDYYYDQIKNILSKYFLPFDYNYPDFIKKLSNGDLVFFKNDWNNYSSKIDIYTAINSGIFLPNKYEIYGISNYDPNLSGADRYTILDNYTLLDSFDDTNLKNIDISNYSGFAIFIYDSNYKIDLIKLDNRNIDKFDVITGNLGLYYEDGIMQSKLQERDDNNYLTPESYVSPYIPAVFILPTNNASDLMLKFTK